MLRRPLDKIKPHPGDYDSLVDHALIFFNLAVERFEIRCTSPLVLRNDYQALFQLIGFSDCPLNPNIQKKLLWPETAPAGKHETVFLQWGVEVKHKNHIVFEIADAGRCVRLDFKGCSYENRDAQTYQLDELRVWLGDREYSFDCGDLALKSYVDRAVKCISSTIQHWRSGGEVCANEADECFTGISAIIKDFKAYLVNESFEIAAQQNKLAGKTL